MRGGNDEKIPRRLFKDRSPNAIPMAIPVHLAHSLTLLPAIEIMRVWERFLRE